MMFQGYYFSFPIFLFYSFAFEAFDDLDIILDYIHRVSGRGGLALNLVTQVSVALSTRHFKLFSANNVAEMKMMDDGFDEKAKERKKQKLKMLAEKRLLKETSKKRN
jgi:ATP-dependent RNA helicase DDX49/DBP8